MHLIYAFNLLEGPEVQNHSAQTEKQLMAYHVGRLLQTLHCLLYTNLLTLTLCFYSETYIFIAQKR